MNWLNIQTTTLRSPEFIGSEPAARAAWLSVMAYCCEQENGGVIPGCRGWKDRQWQQMCGVTLEEINSADLLLNWDGDNLIVWSYPRDKEFEVKRKREGGKVGGKASGEARAKLPSSSSRSTPSSSASSSASSSDEALLERKGIGKEGEWNRKEKGNGNGNGKEGEPPTPSPAVASAKPPRGLTWKDLGKLSELASWKFWTGYKKDRRDKPYTEKGATLQIDQLKAWGEVRAMAAVRYSARNNYQGIYEEKGSSPARESAQQVRERQRDTQYDSEINVPIIDPMEDHP